MAQFMRLTTRSRFAVSALVDLARHQEAAPVVLADIGQRVGISLSYMEQIFTRLRAAGIVEAMRGPGGGYRLARTAEQVTAAEIILAVDKPSENASGNACGSKKGNCRRDGRGDCAACVVQELWNATHGKIKNYMDSVSLRDLVDETRAASYTVVERAGSTAAIEAAAPFLPEILRQQASIVHAMTGSVLFEPNQPADTMYCVLEGIVSLKCPIGGAEVMLQTAIPGDWLMEPLTGSHSTGTRAVCERNAILLAVPARAFDYCLQQDAHFARQRWQEVGRQIAQLQRQAQRLRLPLAAERIVHYLDTESAAGCGEMTLPYSRAVWAKHLAITPATLSRTLKTMQAEGAIVCRGRQLRLVRRKDAAIS